MLPSQMRYRIGIEWSVRERLLYSDSVSHLSKFFWSLLQFPPKLSRLLVNSSLLPLCYWKILSWWCLPISWGFCTCVLVIHFCWSGIKIIENEITFFWSSVCMSLKTTIKLKQGEVTVMSSYTLRDEELRKCIHWIFLQLLSMWSIFR